MNKLRGLILGLLPLAVLADGVHSISSAPFVLDTGGLRGGARWVSAVSSAFLLDTWTPCCSETASAESAVFSFQPRLAVRALTGLVRGTDTGLPLAEVNLSGASQTGTSGPNGYFRLAPVVEGEGYSLFATLPDYLPTNLSGLVVPEYQPAFTPVWLEPIRPAAVTGLSITSDGENYFLNWSPVAGATGYRVRAAWDPYGYWNRVGSTTETSFSAPLPPEVDQARLFRVMAVQ